MDILGNFLRATPWFRGKHRLRNIWERSLRSGERRLARLPEGSTIEVEMDIPYDRMVWLQAEEWEELQYLQRRLHRNDTFVDVGANLGLWTLVAASSVGSDGRVISLEPNPATFQRLVANINRNGKEHIVAAYPQAASRTNGSVSFACARDHNLSGISNNPNSGDVISVESVSLDSLLHEINVTGMKIDTEGHELFTLEGAVRTIKTASPWLIIEFNTTLLPSPFLKDWNVYQFLSALEYKPFIYEGHQEATPIEASFSIQGYRNILFQRNAP